MINYISFAWWLLKQKKSIRVLFWDIYKVQKQFWKSFSNRCVKIREFCYLILEVKNKIILIAIHVYDTYILLVKLKAGERLHKIIFFKNVVTYILQIYFRFIIILWKNV